MTAPEQDEKSKAAAEVEQGSSPEVNDAVATDSGAATTTAAASAAAANPEDSGSGQVEAVDGNSDGAVAVEKKEEPSVVCLESGPVSDMEKKQRRAERFGVGLNFSEDEKRKLRTSRFNSSDKKGVSKAKVAIEAESEKMNARAARFGTGNVATANEEAKKRARIDRFSGVDSNVEAEKKKARAARFAATSNEEGLKKKLRTDSTPVATAAQG